MIVLAVDSNAVAAAETPPLCTTTYEYEYWYWSSCSYVFVQKIHIHVPFYIPTPTTDSTPWADMTCISIVTKFKLSKNPYLSATFFCLFNPLSFRPRYSQPT